MDDIIFTEQREKSDVTVCFVFMLFHVPCVVGAMQTVRVTVSSHAPKTPTAECRRAAVKLQDVSLCAHLTFHCPYNI
jgi:hypothetical protein